MSALYNSPCKAYDYGVTMAITVSFTDNHLQDNKMQRHISGFQELVRAYKNLLAPSTIDAELELSLLIEAQDVPAPEVDPTTIKQNLRLALAARKGKKTGEKERSVCLVLDFRYVKEIMPPASPRVSTTYTVRNRTAVSNEWHFLLTRCPAYGLGIFIYLPGTSLRYFIDMVISNDSKSSYPSDGTSFQFPLDLIAWQIFDFFTNRVTDEKLNNGRGFAPSSLHCVDETLGRLLSRFFSSWGLPNERNIETSIYKGIPEEYEEHLIGLPNRKPEWMPLRDLGAVLVCRNCHQLFVCASLEQGTCKSCNKRSSSSISRPGPFNRGGAAEYMVALPPLYSSKEMNAQADKRKKDCEGYEGQFNGKRLRKTGGTSLFPGFSTGGAQCL